MAGHSLEIACIFIYRWLFKLNLLFKFYFNLVIGLKNISILERKKNSFDLFMFFKINSYYKCPMSQNAGELGQMI
jgi:hypothetical protein